MAIARKHCKTCRCGVKLERHVCAKCGTRKLEKFMIRTGARGAFGKERWRCIERPLCQANVNYGMSSSTLAALEQMARENALKRTAS